MSLTLCSAENNWNNNKQNDQKICENVKFDKEVRSFGDIGEKFMMKGEGEVVVQTVIDADPG